jgi:hypothetical protein
VPYLGLLIPSSSGNRHRYKELNLKYIKPTAGIFRRPQNKTPSLTLERTAFAQFYDAYAPKLWGLILAAKLPAQESETILINTISKAWQQVEDPPLSEKQLIVQLIRLACQEGLPLACLRAVFKPTL